MVKTFEEILDEHFEDRFSNYPNIHFEKVLELMKLVRLQTMVEIANKADADYNIINSNIKDEYFREEQIEVYVLKESILQLDKNSIKL
jgi:hypothetical protein